MFGATARAVMHGCGKPLRRRTPLRADSWRFGNTRDAAKEKDYKAAAVYACALLARPFSWERFCYDALICLYFAEKQLKSDTFAARAALQFRDIARVPGVIWRARFVSEMHEVQ